MRACVSACVRACVRASVCARMHSGIFTLAECMGRNSDTACLMLNLEELFPFCHLPVAQNRGEANKAALLGPQLNLQLGLIDTCDV